MVIYGDSIFFFCDGYFLLTITKKQSYFGQSQNKYVVTSSFRLFIQVTRIEFRVKDLGIKGRTIGNMLGSHWEFHGNTLGTTKNLTPTLHQKKKKIGPLGYILFHLIDCMNVFSYFHSLAQVKWQWHELWVHIECHNQLKFLECEASKILHIKMSQVESDFLKFLQIT